MKQILILKKDWGDRLSLPQCSYGTGVCVCVFVCLFVCTEHYWTEYLRNWWIPSLGYWTVHGIIVCVRTFLDVFAPKLVKTCLTCFSCVYLRVLTMRTPRACVHYTHVRAHTLEGFSPKSMDTFLRSQKLARHNWFIRAVLRVYAMCVGVRMCAFAHFWMYSLQYWWKHPSAYAICFYFGPSAGTIISSNLTVTVKTRNVSKRVDGYIQGRGGGSKGL
jgi:hypothetical protein